MTATTQPPRARAGGDMFYKLAALGVWSLSTWTTFQFVSTLSGNAAWSFWLAVLLQAAMTGLESPIWRGRGGPVSYIVLAVDTFINVGGVAPLAANVDQTASFATVAASLGIAALPPGGEILLAAGLGVLLAAGPEALWNSGKA